MKKIVIILFSALLFNNSFAQLSDRSKPFSFSYNISEINKISSFSEKINLPNFNLDSLKTEDAINDLLKGSYRFGYNHFVNYSPLNSGYWTELENGDKVWQLEITSQNAKTLNFAFSDFKLPKGAKLWIYNLDKNDYIGGFTNDINSDDGFFATDFILGNTAIIEYYVPAGVSEKNPFTLFRVTHGYRGLGVKSDEKLYGDAGACNVNINCPSGDNWQDQKRSSAYTISSSGNEVCSGALINNTLNDGTPYFLTANHCYSSFGNLSLMVFKFNFEAPTCNFAGMSVSHDALTGASLVAKSSGSDFCLLLLKNNLPASYNLYLSGWNRSETVTDSVVCIHHPAGDVTKISFSHSATKSNYSGVQAWKTGTWGDSDGDGVSDGGGVTEGGSSGSPLYDENKRIIGQLYGGPSSCAATGTNRLDYYGRVGISWEGEGSNTTRLKDWLDPCNAGDTGIDGIYASNIATFTNEAKLVDIVAPESYLVTCDNFISPVLKIENKSIQPITSIQILYTLSNGTSGTLISTTTINAGATANINFEPMPNLPAANYIATFTISLVNGITDEVLCNNSKTSVFTIKDVTATTLSSFTEGFESATFPPNGFTIKNPDSGTVTWEQNNSNGGYSNTTKSMKMNFWTSVDKQVDYFYTPYFSLLNRGIAKFYFDYAHKRYSTKSDSLFIEISEDCGSTWVELSKKGGSSLSTSAAAFTQYNAVVKADWKTDTIDLEGFLEGPNLQIRLSAKSNNGNNLYIDNINLRSESVTAIKENKKINTSVLVFPNPAENTLSINLQEIKADKIYVYSAIGSLAKTIQTNNQSLQNIDISDLSKGVYFIKIVDKTQTIHNARFIKN